MRSLRFLITYRSGRLVEKLLIIDDDVALTQLFSDYLKAEHFDVTLAHDGLAGLEMAKSDAFDLIILDVMLPKMTGTEVLIKLRQISSVPILMFTAKGEDLDRIIGLESGADDYVPKPCSPRELVARIRAILRRTERQTDGANSELTVGPLKLSSETRRASWFDKDLELTSTEFNLLQTLASNAGHVVSKETLSEQALGRKLVRYDRSIDVHMSSIRQKLGHQEDGHGYIQTIRGRGYQLIKGDA
jgi:DNA-binding response OmpR family regulator